MQVKHAASTVRKLDITQFTLTLKSKSRWIWQLTVKETDWTNERTESAAQAGRQDFGVKQRMCAGLGKAANNMNETPNRSAERKSLVLISWFSDLHSSGFRLSSGRWLTWLQRSAPIKPQEHQWTPALMLGNEVWPAALSWTVCKAGKKCLDKWVKMV